jgi:hypothetical protein
LQDPERVRRELSTAGLRNVEVDTVTETLEFRTGEAVWEWLVSSNPIVESLFESLNLTNDEISQVRTALVRIAQDHADTTGMISLMNPVNIGMGMK